MKILHKKFRNKRNFINNVKYLRFVLQIFVCMKPKTSEVYTELST